MESNKNTSLSTHHPPTHIHTQAHAHGHIPPTFSLKIVKAAGTNADLYLVVFVFESNQHNRLIYSNRGFVAVQGFHAALVKSQK